MEKHNKNWIVKNIKLSNFYLIINSYHKILKAFAFNQFYLQILFCQYFDRFVYFVRILVVKIHRQVQIYSQLHPIYPMFQQQKLNRDFQQGQWHDIDDSFHISFQINIIKMRLMETTL